MYNSCDMISQKKKKKNSCDIYMHIYIFFHYITVFLFNLFILSKINYSEPTLYFGN